MAELAAPQGDWDDMNIDDVAIKMWIPDVLDECLDTLRML